MKRGLAPAFTKLNNMHKYYIFFLFLFVSGSSFAQRLHAVYEYMPSPMATFQEQVYYDGTVKIAVRDSVPKRNQDINKDIDGEVAPTFSMTIGSGKLYNKIVIQQNNASQQLETRSIEGVNYLVTDQFPSLVWNTNYTDVDTLGKYVALRWLLIIPMIFPYP
ncbi:hypothetical protein D3C81_746400 [compost metagenome]